MNRTYVLDTNIVSYFLRGTFHITEGIKSALVAGNNITISSITYYEIKRGLFAIGNKRILQRFEAFCNDCKIDSLPIEIFNLASIIHADLRKKGLTIEDADIFIAAYCIHSDSTLVTHNVKHFKNIENLKFIDWISE